MRKIVILILIVLLLFSNLAFGDNTKAKQGTKKQSSPSKYVTKTYFLKHISPQTVERSLHAYFFQHSYDRNGNMITVKMLKENIADFEELLKKMDVEKKKVLIRVFTVIASNEGKSSIIENKDLKRVLSELQKVLSFKAFRVDGASALTVKDGQDHGHLLLSSKFSLMLELKNIYIRKDKDGHHTVGFKFILNQEGKFFSKESKLFSTTLIASETSVKENGYLVAGVSKIGKNGDSLVLVINAEIK